MKQTNTSADNDDVYDDDRSSCSFPWALFSKVMLVCMCVLYVVVLLREKLKLIAF